MNETVAKGAMQIILHAGDARMKTAEALRALEEFDIESAKKYLAEAKVDIVEAHKSQTVELQREANGENTEFSVLLTHAQDTCMTVYSEMNIAEHLIKLTEKLDQRISKLENK